VFENGPTQFSTQSMSSTADGIVVGDRQVEPPRRSAEFTALFAEFAVVSPGEDRLHPAGDRLLGDQSANVPVGTVHEERVHMDGCHVSVVKRRVEKR